MGVGRSDHVGVGRIHHVGVCVADIAASVRFYEELGFAAGAPITVNSPEAAAGNGLPAIDMRVCFLSREQHVIELLHHRHRPPARPRAHGEVGHTTWTFPLPDARDAVVHEDPDGVVVRLVSGGAGVHVAAVTGDPAVTRGLFAALGDPDVELSAGTGAPPVPGEPGCTHVCVEVDAIDAALDAATRAGHHPLSQPFDHAGELLWAFVRDAGGGGNVEVLQPLR